MIDLGFLKRFDFVILIFSLFKTSYHLKKNIICTSIIKFIYFQSCELKKDTDEFNATKKKFTEFQVQIEAATSEIKDQCFEFIQVQ